MATPTRPFDLILFDLGGVLIELAGVDQMLSWAGQIESGEGLWRQWLSSEAVRAFESGQSSARRFADEMINEFNLPVSPKRFLDQFVRWPKGPFAGTQRLLAALAERFSLGVLSNTNELHWRRIRREMDLIPFFDWVFPSHLTGRLKPDRATYRHAAEAAGCAPDRILFFDDNQINVDGAKAVGMKAYTVFGVKGVTRKLIGLGLLDPDRFDQNNGSTA